MASLCTYDAKESLRDDCRLSRIRQESRRHWQAKLEAINVEDHLPPACSQLEQVLGPTPQYLGLEASTGLRKVLTEDLLVINGTSHWKVSDNTCPDIHSKNISHYILLATAHPPNVLFTNASLVEDWFEIELKRDGITPMVHAWAYISSALWVEKVRALDPELDCSMIYTKSSTLSLPTYDLGNVDEAGRFWWNAVLSRDWCASFSWNEISYHSPWALQSQSSDLGISPYLPPSAEQAARYLAEFCALHGLERQCNAALATCLFIPFMKRSGLNLPAMRDLPSPHQRRTPAAFQSVLQQVQLLPYYLTLSSSPWGMRALLHGTFFNSEVACNEIDAWLCPIFEVVKPAAEKGRWRDIAILMAKQCPKLAPLWIGSILSGAASLILGSVSENLWAICLTAAGWTNTRHSFIGPTQNTVSPCAGPIDSSRHYYNDRIKRAEEGMLLYLTGDIRAPVCPWKPFGEVLKNETALEVQQHIDCYHFLRYQNWSWEGSTMQDFGYQQQEIPAELEEDTEACSGETTYAYHDDMARAATKSIFGWLRSDGWPICERFIHSHPWFDDDSDEGSTSSERGSEIVITSSS